MCRAGRIVCRLGEILNDRGMTLTKLPRPTGITMANLSIFKTGKTKSVRFSTRTLIWEALDCQSGELLTLAEALRPEDAQIRSGRHLPAFRGTPKLSATTTVRTSAVQRCTDHGGTAAGPVPPPAGHHEGPDTSREGRSWKV